MRVLTIGTFDLLHHGHIAFLRQCQRLQGGRELIVGVNTDRWVSQFKGPPVMTETERVHALYQLGFEAELNDGPGRELIDQLRPAILAIGSDWALKCYHAQIDCTQEWLDARRITLAYIPYDLGPHISTSEIKHRIWQRVPDKGISQ